jgi:hypothetical protein
MFDHKSFLVTGGTGSFGKEFTKTLLQRYSPKRLVIYSRDELKQFEMSQTYSGPEMRYYIGDVRDGNRLEQAMNGIDYVVHAAGPLGALRRPQIACLGVEVDIGLIDAEDLGVRNAFTDSSMNFCQFLRILRVSFAKRRARASPAEAKPRQKPAHHRGMHLDASDRVGQHLKAPGVSQKAHAEGSSITRRRTNAIKASFVVHGSRPGCAHYTFLCIHRQIATDWFTTAMNQTFFE